MSNRLLGLLSVAVVALSALTFASAPAQAEADSSDRTVGQIDPVSPTDQILTPEVGDPNQPEVETEVEGDPESDLGSTEGPGAETPVAPGDPSDSALPNELDTPAPREEAELDLEQLPAAEGDHLSFEETTDDEGAEGAAPEAETNGVVANAAAVCNAANTEKEPKSEQYRNDAPDPSSAEALGLGVTRCGHLGTPLDKPGFTDERSEINALR